MVNERRFTEIFPVSPNQTFGFDRVEPHRLAVLPQDLGEVPLAVAEEGNLGSLHLADAVHDTVQDVQNDPLHDTLDLGHTHKTTAGHTHTQPD